MLDIKKWLKTAGEPVAETCFPPGEEPCLPYVVYLDDISRKGADLKNALTRHSMSIERYSVVADYNPALEKLLEAQALKYRRSRQWLSDMECYLTVYDLETDLIEREVL